MDEQGEVTRREFLKTATTATAVLVLPRLSEGASQPGVASSNSTVNYGIIGTGTEGCTLLRELTRISGAQCVATCDIYPPNQRKASRPPGRILNSTKTIADSSTARTSTPCSSQRPSTCMPRCCSTRFRRASTSSSRRACFSRKRRKSPFAKRQPPTPSRWSRLACRGARTLSINAPLI